MLAVLFVSQLAAFVVLAALLVAGVDLPTREAALWAGGGALAGTAALGAFYRGLAIGTMSIVAPVSACGAAIPVIVGLATGERPSTLKAVGIAVAFVGIVLAARETDGSTGSHRASIVLGLLAAVGFGTFFVSIDRATETSDALGVVAVARIAAMPALIAVVLAVRPQFPGRAALPALAVIGLLDVSANVLFAVATTAGLLAVVSVLGSLYPAVTVVLARFFLHERLGRVQQAGVVAAFSGVVMISAG